MSALLQPDEASALLDAAIRGDLPDERGRFGPFGGRYVPETLVPAFERLDEGVREHLYDESFQAEFHKELREWVGRPTALTHRTAPERKLGRRGLAKARRPGAHRRAQD